MSSFFLLLTNKMKHDAAPCLAKLAGMHILDTAQVKHGHLGPQSLLKIQTEGSMKYVESLLNIKLI